MQLVSIIIIFGLINFRISKMLKDEDGLLGIFIKLRMKIGIVYYFNQELVVDVKEYREIQDNDGEMTEIYLSETARLFSCLWCLSIWVGFGISLLYTTNLFELFSITFASSTIAILIDELLGRIRCVQTQ